MKVGVISDTHGHLDPNILNYFRDCQQIWHAGDVGNIEILDRLKEAAELKAVYGNIDDNTVRTSAPEHNFFKVGNVKILITHIAGTPPRYNPGVKKILAEKTPDILVCGHSHILKVMRDPANNLLFINPGAAGVHGFHKIRTLITFEINSDKIENMNVIELGKRGAIG